MKQRNITDKTDDTKERSLYTAFLKKNKDAPAPFPLTKYLIDFLKETKANGIFIMPGVLSSTEDSWKKLLHMFLTLDNLEFFGFGNAYYPTYKSENGTQKKLTQEEEKKEQDKIKDKIVDHERYIIESGKRILNINRNYQSDHSKMIFIFRYKGEGKWNFCDVLTIDNYDCFLEHIEIIAVSTGSSNFSHSAYGINEKKENFQAFNGESDILMFYDKEYKKKIYYQIREEQKKETSQIVLSENITPVDKDFFEDMLRNLFKYILEKA